MVAVTRQTRRPARRADENAPPTNNGAPTTRSRASLADPTLAIKSATIASSLPVMKRQSSSTAVPTNGKALPPSKRSALGDVTTAGKNAEKNGLKKERKPLVSTRSNQQVPTRARIAATEVKKEERVTTKRKATIPAKLPSTSTAPLKEKILNNQTDLEAEPANKRRKTSTPPLEEDVEDLGDEEQYDEDGREILLSSGGRGVSLRSPKIQSRCKDEGWTDLDTEDDGDPSMVSEYVVDAFNYMLAIETITMPNPDYMNKQAELQWKMRGILMDWLIEVHSKFRLLPETLFIATNLIDRFLSARVISLVKFQLVGLTALFVAAKYEEVICPSISHFLHMTDGGYGVEEVLKAERYLLSTLSFDLSYPNPLHFLRRISKADGYDIQSRTVAKFLVEISCVEHRLLRYPPSLLAAAGIWLARMCLDRGEWTPNLVHYSTYSADEVLECAQTMLDHILDPEFNTDTSFYKKYASKKHMKASIFVHKWAVERFPTSEYRGEELAMALAGEL